VLSVVVLRATCPRVVTVWCRSLVETDVDTSPNFEEESKSFDLLCIHGTQRALVVVCGRQGGTSEHRTHTVLVEWIRKKDTMESKHVVGP
jgi:hypothetical protein